MYCIVLPRVLLSTVCIVITSCTVSRYYRHATNSIAGRIVPFLSVKGMIMLVVAGENLRYSIAPALIPIYRRNLASHNRIIRPAINRIIRLALSCTATPRFSRIAGDASASSSTPSNVMSECCTALARKCGCHNDTSTSGSTAGLVRRFVYCVHISLVKQCFRG